MKTDEFKDQTGSEHGGALVVTLLFLTVLGAVATSLVFTTQSEMRSSVVYKYSQQSMYVANGGVQRAVAWFNNSYIPHQPSADYDITNLPISFGGQSVLLSGQTGIAAVYPESEVKTAFHGAFTAQSLLADEKNSGHYSINATLLKHTPVTFLDPTTFIAYSSATERWRLSAVGNWGTEAAPLGTTRITAIIENSGNAIFDRALWGIDSFSLGGTVLIDSYDSSIGAYGGNNVGQDGSIGTNGDASTNGNVTVKGSLAYGPAGTYTHVGGGLVTGQVIQLPEPRIFPPIPDFTVGTTAVSLGGHDTQTLAAGSYGAINLSSNAVLTFSGGTYYIDSLTTTGQADIVISAATTLFIKSAFSLGGGSVINSTAVPSNLTVWYSGTSTASLAGGSGFYGDVYAPNATVTLVGNSNFYGSFVGKVVNDSGTPNVHFDERSSDKNLEKRPFRVITWSQDTF